MAATMEVMVVSPEAQLFRGEATEVYAQVNSLLYPDLPVETAGLVALVITDIAFVVQVAAGTYHSGIATDAGWPLAFLILASTAWADVPSVTISSAKPKNRSAGMQSSSRTIAC